MFRDKDLPSLPFGANRRAPPPHSSARADATQDVKELRRQLALNATKIQQVATLERENSELRRQIAQQNDFIAQLARSLRAAFDGCLERTRRSQEESSTDRQIDEVIQVYSTFEVDDSDSA